MPFLIVDSVGPDPRSLRLIMTRILLEKIPCEIRFHV